MHLRLIIAPLLLAATIQSPGYTVEPVRRYPDPSYRKIGVYAGGPKTYFDYSLGKMSIGTKFPNKKRWWTSQKKASKTNSPHEILIVYCGIRGGKDFEHCRTCLDAWLKPEPGIPTYPEAIPAICLEEENVSSRSKLMDRVARHIRDNYRIPVFQWYTDPFTASTAVTADGWIWDSYGWSPSRFRRHVMNFVLLGKPVICVPWASDPHWPQWTKYPTTQKLIDREWHQFTTCLEFNVSTAPFCVAGPGAMNPWLGSDTPDMKLLRSALRSKRRQMRALRADDLPLATANFSAAARAIPVGGEVKRPSRYVDDFAAGTIIQDATISGFMDLMLTSRPATPGFLVVRPRPKSGRAVQRSVRTSLTYHLKSYFPLKKVRVRLRATAPRAVGAKNSIALSTSEFAGPSAKLVEQSNQEELGTLLLQAGPATLRGSRDVFVTLRMAQKKGRSDILTHRLDQLVFECEHQPPKPRAIAQLMADQYGSLSYDDDFSTTRFSYFGEVKASAKSHGGYLSNGFWVGLKGGSAISTSVLQRVSAPKILKNLEVSVNCYANSPDLGGSITLAVTPRGQKKLKWTVRTVGRHGGWLTLKVPTKQLAGLRHFDVHVLLHSSSGVEQGSKACASVSALRIRGK